MFKNYLILALLIFQNTYSQTGPHQMVQRMGRGTNLGNILSAPNEGDWATPVTEQYIDDLYALRFKTVRIPIRFDIQTTPFSSVTYTDGNGNYIGSPSQYTVNVTYLNRIEQIVDWCLNRNMIPIIDVHGDHWFWESFDSGSTYYATGNDRLARIDRFKAIWRDISVRFQNKHENLLFEIMNEPFFSMNAIEVADINSQMLAVIRQTNPTRNVIITGGGQNSHEAPLQIPNTLIQSDPYLIATYHYYQPRAFTASASQAQTDNDWGTATDKAQIDTHFDQVKTWATTNNIPIYMGEYGADNEGGYNYDLSTYGLYGGPDIESRRLFHEYVGNAARERGFSFSVWDAGEKSGKTVYLANSRGWVKDVRNAVLNKTCLASGIIENADVECNYDYNWSLNATTGNIASLYNAYENESYNQSVSLKVKVTQTTGSLSNVILSNQEATTNFTIGNTYNFECKAKALATGQTFRIRIRALVNGTYVNNLSSIFNLTSNYENYSYTFTVPANTTSLTYQILCGANLGTYLFDEFKMSGNTICATTTTWNGTSWSNGNPTLTTNAVFNGNFTSTSNLSACKVTINSNFNVTINPSHTLTVANNIQIANNANLIIENNAAVVQNSTQSNIGNVQVKRNSTPMRRLDYTAWSSPVTGQQLLAFTPQTLTNRFYTYLYSGFTTPTAFINVNPNSNFLTANGYIIRIANNWSSTIASSYNGSFIGELNNGNYSYFSGKGFNLVGNPYPSPLNANTFLTENPHVNTLYFWTHQVAAVGGTYPINNYASYTTLGGTAANAGGSVPNGFVQTGQGFFVRTINHTPIVFKNTQRTNATSSTQFFKNSQNNSKQLIWLDFYKGDESLNQILLGFTPEATDNYDNAIDGVIFNNQTNCLYSNIAYQNEDYVIQGKSYPLKKDDQFNLGYHILENGIYTISLNNSLNIDSKQPIYLFDKKLNIYFDLRKGAYTFESEAGKNNSRFEIVFQTNQNDLYNNTIIYQNNNVISLQNQNKKIKKIEVFDVIGKKLNTYENINLNTFQFNHSSNQILLLKIILVDEQIENHKIIVQ